MLFLGGGLFLHLHLLLLLLLMMMMTMTAALASALILPSFPVMRLTRIHLVLLSKIPPVVLLHNTLHSINGIGDMLHCIRPLSNFSGPPGFPLHHLKFVSQVTSFNGLLFLSGSLPLLIVLLMMVMTMTALIFPSMSLEISFPWRLLLPLRFLLGMMVMVVVGERRGFNGSLDVLLGVGRVREGVVSVRTTRESLRGWESDYRGGCYESDDGSGLKTHD